MSILSEFYLGKINPCEKYIKSKSDYSKLSKRFDVEIEELKRLMNENQKELFNKIENTESELEAILEEESYIEGFCTGAKIMLEILSREI